MDIGPTIGLAALVIFVFRPVVLGVVLSRARMSWEALGFVAWFGPRGLNSLLLALLVVQAELDDAVPLLATIGVVVLASALLHGATATPLSAWYARRAMQDTLPEERETTATALFQHDSGDVERIGADELQALLASPTPPVILDVRSRSSYARDAAGIPGSVRVEPDQVREWAVTQPKARLVVAYCT